MPISISSNTSVRGSASSKVRRAASAAPSSTDTFSASITRDSSHHPMQSPSAASSAHPGFVAIRHSTRSHPTAVHASTSSRDVTFYLKPRLHRQLIDLPLRHLRQRLRRLQPRSRRQLPRRHHVLRRLRNRRGPSPAPPAAHRDSPARPASSPPPPQTQSPHPASHHTSASADPAPPAGPQSHPAASRRRRNLPRKIPQRRRRILHARLRRRQLPRRLRKPLINRASSSTCFNAPPSSVSAETSASYSKSCAAVAAVNSRSEFASTRFSVSSRASSSASKIAASINLLGLKAPQIHQPQPILLHRPAAPRSARPAPSTSHTPPPHPHSVANIAEPVQQQPLLRLHRTPPASPTAHAPAPAPEPAAATPPR